MFRQVTLVLVGGAALAATLASAWSAVQKTRHPAALGSWRGVPANWLDPEVVARRTKALDEAVRAREHFKTFLGSLLRDLDQGRMTFQEACILTQDTAPHISPTFLPLLRFAPGENVLEKIGRRFVLEASFVARCQPASEAAARLARKLSEELASSAFQTWCRQSHRRTTDYTDNSAEEEHKE